MTKTRQYISYAKVWAEYHLPEIGTTEEDNRDLLWAKRELEDALYKVSTALFDRKEIGITG